MKLTVIGLPVSQGSKSARVVRGRAILTDGFGDKPRRLRDWRASVAACARLWLQQNGMLAPLDGPVELTATFYLPRPKSATKRPTKWKPPGKLLRGDASAKASYGMTIGAKAWAFRSIRAKPIKNTSTSCAGGKKVGALSKTD